MPWLPISTSFSLKLIGSHPLSPHTYLSPPDDSLLASAVGLSGVDLGIIVAMDTLSWVTVQNVPHLSPYLVCHVDACNMVNLKALHLSPLQQGGLPGSKLLGSLLPSPAFSETPWPVTANGKKVLDIWGQGNLIPMGWMEWPRSSDIW